MGSEFLLTGTTVSVLLICALLAVAFDGAEVRTRRGDRIPRLSKPEQRADALLKEWLSPEQRSTLHKYGFFEVRGSHTGKCYRIRRGRNMNIYEVGTGQTQVAIPTDPCELRDIPRVAPRAARHSTKGVQMATEPTKREQPHSQTCPKCGTAMKNAVSIAPVVHQTGLWHTNVRTAAM